MNSGGEVIEFRSGDDAWYDVWLELSGEELTVRYKGFENEKEVFRATAYGGAPEKLEELEKRFRTLSMQIQDSECSKVVLGSPVCASYAVNDESRHFYDAVGDEVSYNKHSFANGEEECLCTFVLLWLHGPNARNLTTAKIADICLIQPSEQVHPLLTSLLNMARKSGGTQLANQELKCAVQPMASKGTGLNYCEVIESDTNMGGASSHHLVMVENLEKGLAASTIVDFIHKHTSHTPEVYVFPNVSLEPYTRGIIALDCQKKFQDICCFLDSPNHIIISSRGRPWMTTGKVLTRDPMVTTLLKSQNQFRFGSAGIGSQLKLVYAGTQEHVIAAERKELYTHFFNHLKGLHKRLLSEDDEILTAIK